MLKKNSKDPKAPLRSPFRGRSPGAGYSGGTLPRMKYPGLPAGMWALFVGSFRSRLTDALGYDRPTAAEITKKAHATYRALIGRLPAFEKGDRFQMNLVSCAMLAAFVLNMPKRPRVDELTSYYAAAMMTGPMRCFCRVSGRRKFSERDVADMKRTAAFRAADRNPYSWNMDFLPYPDGSGYEARFNKCGICTLMGELGLADLVPAMCRLDYAMSEAGGADVFVRRYTLASGGAYCDCGYRKKGSGKP